jgi:hypothetical protein
MRYKGKHFWLFVTHEDHVFQTNILGRDFENEWMKISPDGEILIKGTHVQENDEGGYAWDGCSPKYAILDIVAGTPDGVVDETTEKPKTYFASMVHDALYQFGRQAKIKRPEADKLFLKMLKGFKLKYLYYFAVRLLGWWAFYLKKR